MLISWPLLLSPLASGLRESCSALLCPALPPWAVLSSLQFLNTTSTIMINFLSIKSTSESCRYRQDTLPSTRNLHQLCSACGYNRGSDSYWQPVSLPFANSVCVCKNDIWFYCMYMYGGVHVCMGFSGAIPLCFEKWSPWDLGPQISFYLCLPRIGIISTHHVQLFLCGW